MNYSHKKRGLFLLACLVAVLLPTALNAQETTASPPEKAESLALGLDTFWVLFGAFLVFFMQPGFAMVEAGFVRAKNVCNILLKNVLDYCVASVLFMICGYAFMFGDGCGFIGWKGFFLNEPSNPSGLPFFAFFLFQTAFCGCAATIVAGGVAERIRFSAYMIYTVVLSALIYPIIGHWVWGGGWLSDLGFIDFAGSTVVHTTGGVISLVGAAILGARIGKFDSQGKARPLPGHNLPLVALGAFILWFGWFGFNPCSSLGISTQSAIDQVSRVALNTNISAAVGAITALFAAWKLFGKTDVTMACNGMLAGLVAITAPCHVVAPWSALCIGAVAGVLVVLGVVALDKLHIDDPVGAFPVHGINGIWGTLSIGLFAVPELAGNTGGVFYGGGLKVLGIQALGSTSVIAFAAITMGSLFYAIKAFRKLRVKRDDEIKGIDITEHGLEGYADFQSFITK